MSGFTLKGFCGIPFLALVLFCLPNSARGDILTTCSACDGDRFAITYFLESDDGTTSVYDVTLLADTSGNNIGGTHHIDAVAIALNGVTVESALDAAPNGAANWTGKGGGLSNGGNGGCNGSGAFICASALSGFEAVAPNASTATTPYQWTWDVDIADSTPGGAASVFSSAAGVKIHYDDVNGHLVSSDFTFIDPLPPSAVPEPASILLLGTTLYLSLRLSRKKFSS
jgi:hypothetical protein